MNTYNLKTTRERELFPGFFGKFIHTDYMTLVYWSIEADSPLAGPIPIPMNRSSIC